MNFSLPFFEPFAKLRQCYRCKGIWHSTVRNVQTVPQNDVVMKQMCIWRMIMKVTELEKCIELYGKDIFAFCRQLTYSRQEAEELYQDTFLKAMELLHKIRVEENPKSYLLSITLRLCKNSKRKYARRRQIAGIESLVEEDQGIEDQGCSLEEEVVARERAKEVRDAVRELAEKYRMPVYLYYMEELTMPEIARVLKIPKGTVKSRLYQARKLLRERLEVE